MTTVLDLFWIVPLAVVGFLVMLLSTYIVWSVPIWALETIQGALRFLLARRAQREKGADSAGPPHDLD
ncbi:MAG: hypothetical protein WCQ45_03280 [bacterium]